jgi:hypothetical protein
MKDAPQYCFRPGLSVISGQRLFCLNDHGNQREWYRPSFVKTIELVIDDVRVGHEGESDVV